MGRTTSCPSGICGPSAESMCGPAFRAGYADPLLVLATRDPLLGLATRDPLLGLATRDPLLGIAHVLNDLVAAQEPWLERRVESGETNGTDRRQARVQH